MQRPTMPFRASNAFFYYADLDRATHFYAKILGFTLVADYGKARIFQIAATSFLTLVDNAIGMHSSEEPKTVTLACVVADVEGWYTYLQAQQLPFHKALAPGPGDAYAGFVVLDPEGYFLEFVRFNPHPDNAQLLPRLNPLLPTPPDSSVTPTRPAQLTISATVLWLYYQDTTEGQRFLEATLGLHKVYAQSIAAIYAASPSGFVGTVVAGQGLHSYAEQKAITISLLTDEIEAWHTWLPTQPNVTLRTGEIATRERYKALVAYTPENYYLELNTFLEHADNQRLMRALYPATD
jgi:catechol 2,3-dioxygenase-like lactoylglutathione lyase family enzyme